MKEKINFEKDILDSQPNQTPNKRGRPKREQEAPIININCQDSIQNFDESEVKTADCSPVKLSSPTKPAKKPMISLRNLSTACNSLEIDLNELNQDAQKPKEVQLPMEVSKPTVKPAKIYVYSA